jgi:hypothetical protein
MKSVARLLKDLSWTGATSCLRGPRSVTQRVAPYAWMLKSGFAPDPVFDRDHLREDRSLCHIAASSPGQCSRQVGDAATDLTLVESGEAKQQSF